MLVVVEVCGAVRRETGKLTYAYEAKRTLEDWIKQGKIKLYELDKQRIDKAIKIAMRDGLKGSDAVIAQISEELNLPLRTYNGEFKNNFKGPKVHD